MTHFVLVNRVESQATYAFVRIATVYPSLLSLAHVYSWLEKIEVESVWCGVTTGDLARAARFG